MNFISKSTDTPRWKMIFEITWGIGMLFLALYTALTWPTKYLNDNESFIAQCFILIMLYGGMFGARFRFFQLKIVKAYLVSLGATILMIFLVFRNLGWISSDSMSSFLWIYVIASAGVLLVPTRRVK